MGERGAVATGGATIGAAAESDKTPRTERGRRTLRAILDAAAVEFGTRGFHETSIVGITSRAGVALGSFYTYFSSKDELFRALVRDMSTQVGIVGAAASKGATSVLDGERAVLASFIGFAREHRELYRIIDESEFVDPASYRAHYEGAASRIGARLQVTPLHLCHAFPRTADARDQLYRHLDHLLRHHDQHHMARRRRGAPARRHSSRSESRPSMKGWSDNQVRVHDRRNRGRSRGCT